MNKRPEIDESVKLVLLPWGQTLEDVNAAARAKRRAGLGCILPFALFLALALIAWLGTLLTNGR